MSPSGSRKATTGSTPEAGDSRKRKRRSPSDDRRDERRAATYALTRASEAKTEIQRKARERQEAWAEGGLGDLTRNLAHTLDRRYVDLRAAHSEADVRLQRPEAERQGWTTGET